MKRAKKTKRAIITVTEGKTIDVSISFSPVFIHEEPTACAYYGLVGFKAIADAIMKDSGTLQQEPENPKGD